MTRLSANLDLPAAHAAVVSCGRVVSSKSCKAVKAKGFKSPAMVVLCG